MAEEGKVGLGAGPLPYQKVNVKLVPEGFLSMPIPSWPTAGALVATPAPSTAVLEQKACTEQEPWLVVYLLLGLCLCALICFLLLGWTHLRRRGEVVSCQASAGTCHRGEDCSKGECWLHWGDWEGMGSWWWRGPQVLLGREGKQKQLVTQVGRQHKGSDVQRGLV